MEITAALEAASILCIGCQVCQCVTHDSFLQLIEGSCAEVEEASIYEMHLARSIPRSHGAYFPI